MLRVIRFQSQRRLFRKPDIRDIQRLVKDYGPPSHITSAIDRSQGTGVLGVDVVRRIRDRKSVLDSFHSYWPATHASFADFLPKLRDTDFVARRRIRFVNGIGQKKLLDVISDNPAHTREFSYYAAEQYSDEDTDSSGRSEILIDVDGWRRRLKRFLKSDHQEIITRSRDDRRDFPNMGFLLKEFGLYAQIYVKTVVISKVPLPNYRPDLDEKRPQRLVAFRGSTLDRVDTLLQKYLLRKEKNHPSDNTDVLLEPSKNSVYRSAGGGLLQDITGDSRRHLEGVGGGQLEEERLRRKSWRMRSQQMDWQNSPEGSKVLNFRQTLPAYKEKERLLSLVAHNQVLVVSGETGCGKTTQLPQYILESAIEDGRGALCNIVCTQPRRISAISVAERVAAERGEQLGESVGYQVRLEGKRGAGTKLMYCTSGILLRRLMNDQDLKGVTHVVVDEIHERGMNEDFLLIVLKSLLLRRPDLRLILMSATLNAELFSSYFDKAPMAHISGFTYPVKAHFLEDVLDMTCHTLTPSNQIDDYGQDKQWKMQRQWQFRKRKNQLISLAEGAMENHDLSRYSNRVQESFRCWNPESLNFKLIEKLLCHICNQGKTGAVLVFTTGWEDISSLMDKLRLHPFLGDPSEVMLLACHGSMATEEQKLIFGLAPAGVRKVVLATNMAETSITISDVVYVVDCGKAKETSYDALNNTPCLLPQWISQASARQRRGRAGRVQPGECYHLYPKAMHDALDEYQLPELLRTPLQALCLQIKSLKLGSIEAFLSKALQPPEPLAVENAVELLKTIGALDEQEELTSLGYHLSQLPVEPRLGKMLLMGSIFGCLDPVLTIAAGLTTRDPFLIPMEKKDLACNSRYRFSGDGKSDHLALVNAYNGWLKAVQERRAPDYCWSNFLSSQTLQGMHSLRRQFLGLLSAAGFADMFMDHCNQHSSDKNLVRGVICAGMFPAVASVVQKTKSSSFKTKEDGQVLLHPSSVNSQDLNLVYPWLVFNEKVKTSSVIMRDSTGVSDSILLLFGGEVRRGSQPGQLLMQEGFLEFFMDKDVATMILMLREELDELLQKKLRSPELELYTEGSYLLDAIRELLQGDQCEGAFVYGRKAADQQHQAKEELEDVKGFLQTMVQRGGKHEPPKYKTKTAPGGYQSAVLVKGQTFVGKPGSSKKKAEKNASVVALGWLMQSSGSKVIRTIIESRLNLAFSQNDVLSEEINNYSVASRKKKLRVSA